MELIKDTTNRDLGKRNHECRVCGAKGLFQSYLAREMMQGTRDEFEYFECPKCHCLQIAEVPDNLGDYYGQNYYSMKISKDTNQDFKTAKLHDEKILDVGCGVGEWLYSMAESGHYNLFGCDPFIEESIDYGDRVHIHMCDITQMGGDGTFEIVRMSDSFEHMPNPKEVLQNANRLLKQDGKIVMSIPVYPNIAFDMFGPHWYQLDAPRHLFLHSIVSMKYLADECGFVIEGVEYDSNVSQIVRSFFYENNITYNEVIAEVVTTCFTEEQLNDIQKMSEEANKIGSGDHAKFFLKKIK